MHTFGVDSSILLDLDPQPCVAGAVVGTRRHHQKEVCGSVSQAAPAEACDFTLKRWQ